MWELVKAGGWLMLPLVLCSIFMLAISVERFIRLKKSLVLPNSLLMGPAQNAEQAMQKLQQSSALKNSTLGRVFTAGFEACHQSEQYA
ncbi:biopolymer transporter ExbB, partial [Corynebacterium diphtheriae]